MATVLNPVGDGDMWTSTDLQSAALPAQPTTRQTMESPAYQGTKVSSLYDKPLITMIDV